MYLIRAVRWPVDNVDSTSFRERLLAEETPSRRELLEGEFKYPAHRGLAADVT